MREAIDKYLYPIDLVGNTTDDAPMRMADPDAKVGIDVSQVQDWDKLFDEFEVG